MTMAMHPPRVAFVVQRAGRDINGGAEQLCLQIALRLSDPWDIDILTTRAKDYLTWRDHYPAGEESINPRLRIIRFSVAHERDIPTFGPLCQRLEKALARGTATSSQEDEWIRAQGPYAPELSDFVRTHAADYHAFFFFCYQYATTSLVLPQVADKSFVVPCAHDEWSLHLKRFGEVLTAPRGHIFLSPEEGHLVHTALAKQGRAVPPGRVAAIGFDGVAAGDAQRFRDQTGIREPFALYLGRLDDGKNTPQMLEFWRRLWDESRQSAKLPKLVLIGGTATRVLYHSSVHYLGFVDEQLRNDALAACHFLINPSRYESLSLVLLEAWAAGKPVLVNGDCAVMNGQVARSDGGLTFADYASFAAGVYAMHDESTRRVWGESGRRYVARTYRWTDVAAAYQAALASLG